MASRVQQRLITGGVVGLAVIAMVLAAVYQGDRTIDEPSIVGGITTTAPSGGSVGGDAPTTTVAGVVNPIEGFLPRSGQASACQEAVGVDLAPGYAALLTINGIAIAPEEMNVVLDSNGQPTGQLSATRSLGEYTFGPEADCPGGRVLRPTNNVLEACVYRVQEGPANCVTEQNTFDVL